jgi:hypothetical protein
MGEFAGYCAGAVVRAVMQVARAKAIRPELALAGYLDNLTV